MTGALFISGILCGAFAIASQSYLAREFLVVFLGNEMSLASLLFGWFAGVAAGARFARAGVCLRARSAVLFAVSLLAWMVSLPAALLAVRMSRSIMGVPPGTLAPLWKLLLVSVLFAGPFSAFVGFTFVTICRLWQDVSSRARPIGQVYVAEALGGVAGGVLFTFVLAGTVTPFTFAFFAYVPLGICVAAVMRLSQRRGVLRAGTAGRLLAGSLIVAVMGAAVAFTGRGAVLDANSHVARMSGIAPGVVMEARNSRFQNLTVTLLSGQYTVYGNGEPLVTFPEPLLNELEAHLVLAEQGRGRDVLVAGGGVEFAAALLTAGARRVDYVDTDPAAVEISLPFLTGGAPHTFAQPGLEIHNEDARLFVARAAAAGADYDCIFVRTGEPSTLLLNRLYTREFFVDARAALGSDGVLAVPVTLAGSYLGGEVGRYAGAIHRTLRSVFAEVVATPEVRSTFLAAAKEGVLSTDSQELAARFERRGAASSLYPDAFRLVFPPDRTREINEELSNLPGRVDTDLHPTTYAAHLALWAAISQSPLAKLLSAATGAPRWVVFALPVVLAAVGALYAASGGRARTASLSVLYTGWAAMSLTVLLIYAFQVTCGYVYEWIGFLSAAFVAGTALGAVAGNRAARRPRALALAEVFVVTVPLATIAVLALLHHASAGAAAWVIPALAAAGGFVTGFEFPVAAGLMDSCGMDAREAAGRLEAADHLGACAGAILAGVVIVPALGIALSLLLVASIKALSAVCAFNLTLRGRGGHGSARSSSLTS